MLSCVHVKRYITKVCWILPKCVFFYIYYLLCLCSFGIKIQMNTIQKNGQEKYSDEVSSLHVKNCLTWIQARQLIYPFAYQYINPFIGQSVYPFICQCIYSIYLICLSVLFYFNLRRDVVMPRAVYTGGYFFELWRRQTIPVKCPNLQHTLFCHIRLFLL